MGLPLHDPLDVVSVLPCVGDPLTAGAAVLDGAAGVDEAMAAVAPELAAFEPPALLAVTTDRMV